MKSILKLKLTPLHLAILTAFAVSASYAQNTVDRQIQPEAIASGAGVTLNQATAPEQAGAVLDKGAYAVNAVVGEIRIALGESKPAKLFADGRTPTTVTIHVYDVKGRHIAGNVLVTIETNAGRIVLNGAKTDELSAGRLDADRITSGTQLKVMNGEATFTLMPPTVPVEGKLRVTSGAAFAETPLSYLPELRPLMAVGLLEGTIALRKVRNESLLTGVRTNDGFEEALNRFERSFNQEGHAAARAAFFVKGAISGETLLTTSYDSDKETRTRMLRDIRAEELYPVFGDASLKGFDAKTNERFYIRLDNGKNYALYGDFSTGDEIGRAHV